MCQLPLAAGMTCGNNRGASNRAHLCLCLIHSNPIGQSKSRGGAQSPSRGVAQRTQTQGGVKNRGHVCHLSHREFGGLESWGVAADEAAEVVCLVLGTSLWRMTGGADRKWGGGCRSHGKGHRLGPRQERWGWKRLIMLLLSYKNPGSQAEVLGLLHRCHRWPGAIIGLGLCGKVNCSDHTV